MRKKSAAIVILIIITLLLGWFIYGYGVSDHESGAQYVIGVSQANMRETWRIELINQIEEEAEKYENIRIITTDATSDADKQAQDVKRLREFGIDLLIISPSDTSDMTQMISDVYHEIPVIVMDRAIEGFDYSLFIGPDNALIGRQAAKSIVELLKGEKGEVLELYGDKMSRQSQERSKGFETIMVDYPEIRKQVFHIENATRDQAYDSLCLMKEELQKIDAIFAYNDYMALGAYEALKEMGLENKVKIVGSDGYAGKNEGIDLVKQGKIEATISCPTGGREAVQYALNILNEESGVPKQVILRSHTIAKENADDYLAELNKEYKDIKETITIGYSQVGQESKWRLANTQSIQAAAKEFNVELLFDDADQSQERQIAAVREFIEKQVDVIVISPVVEKGWDEVLREAKEAGIPVVLSDRKIESSEDDLVTTYIGADFLEEGRRAMRWIVKNVPADQEQKKILEIQGNQGASPTEERKAGFRDILEENPLYRIVYSAYGNYTYEGGRSVIERYLKEHDWDIDIIFCHNDDMALGAIEELERFGIEPGVDVKIVSVDATMEAFKAMAAGKLNCSVECNPLLGPPLMKAIKDMMSGKEMPLRIITEEKVYDQTTAEDEIRVRKY